MRRTFRFTAKISTTKIGAEQFQNYVTLSHCPPILLETEKISAGLPPAAPREFTLSESKFNEPERDVRRRVTSFRKVDLYQRMTRILRKDHTFKHRNVVQFMWKCLSANIVTEVTQAFAGMGLTWVRLCQEQPEFIQSTRPMDYSQHVFIFRNLVGEIKKQKLKNYKKQKLKIVFCALFFPYTVKILLKFVI